MKLIPATTTGKTLAVTGVSLAAAAAVAGIVIGVKAYRKSRRPETEEEYVQRIERVAHLDGVYEDGR